MGMNKKELEAWKAMMAERDMYRAMVISPPVEPDIKPPEHSYGGENFERGWLPHFYLGGFAEVMKAATQSGSHRMGDHAWEPSRHSWSQNSRWIYSLRVNALRQARHEASTAYARQLAKLDREIEKAIAAGE